MSVPQLEPWLTPTITQLQPMREEIILKDEADKDRPFTVYYREDNVMFGENTPVQFRQGKVWHGDMAVFKRAKKGHRLVNFRSNQSSDVVWEVVTTWVTELHALFILISHRQNRFLNKHTDFVRSNPIQNATD